jgi:hypothetical protein
VKVTVYLRHREQPLHIPISKEGEAVVSLLELAKVIHLPGNSRIIIEDTILFRDEIQAITVERGR